MECVEGVVEEKVRLCAAHAGLAGGRGYAIIHGDWRTYRLAYRIAVFRSILAFSRVDAEEVSSIVSIDILDSSLIAFPYCACVCAKRGGKSVSQALAPQPCIFG